MKNSLHNSINSGNNPVQSAVQKKNSKLSSNRAADAPKAPLSSAPIGAPLDDDSRANRPKRIPISAQNRLTAPKRPGFVRRFFNDVEDRIARAIDAGWTPVEGDFDIGTVRSKDPSIMGKLRRVSVGRGTSAVLMEIREDWFQEDQAAKHRANRQRVAELTQADKDKGQYGKIEIS